LSTLKNPQKNLGANATPAPVAMLSLIDSWRITAAGACKLYVLHNYFRSSTSYRVRIALAMKSVEYEYRSVPLLEKAHKSDAYLAMNPDGLVPTLETPDGFIGQSMAILEYLDEKHPEPALLPNDVLGRARVRSLAHSIALDIHPVNNLRLLQYIGKHFSADKDSVRSWFVHWAEQGFTAVERRLASERDTGKCCHGDVPGLADIALVAQAVNNTRFDVPTAAFPTINRIVEHCLDLPAFASAHPLNQPDAPTS